MQRIPEFHQDVVRDVGYVVDRANAHDLEAVFQPFGRGLHLDVPDHAPAIARAQVRVLNLDRDFTLGRCSGLVHPNIEALKRLAVECRKLARHAIMAETVRAVGSDLEFENPVVARSGYRLRTEPQMFEVVLELPRLDPNLDEFAKPVEGCLHSRW